MSEGVKEENLLNYLKTKKKSPQIEKDEYEEIAASMEDVKVSYESLMELSESLKKVFEGIVEKT